MARDSRLLKRNLLVLPGGLLATVAALGLLYFLTIRKTGAPCAKYTAVAYHGVCYNTTFVLAGVLLIGLILVAIGLAAFRGKPKVLVDHLYHGTPAHFGLTLLSALTAIPAIIYLVVLYLERAANTEYVLAIPGTTGDPAPTMTLHALLGVLIVFGLIALVPYLILMLAQGRLRRRFLQAAETYEEPEPAFPGEPTLAEGGWTEEPADARIPSAPPPEEFVDEAMWPASRDVPEVESSAPRPAPPAATVRPMAPAAAPPMVAPPTGAWNPETAAAAVPVITPRPPEGRRTGPVVRPAPIVAQAPGCRAMKANGTECGEPVGPGGRYCLRHACQGRTASGTPCRNPALEGGTRCRAHSVS